MLIRVEHLRQHGIEKHSVACVRNCLHDYGHDFRDFVRNGIDHTKLILAAQQREDVAELFRFLGLEVPPQN